MLAAVTEAAYDGSPVSLVNVDSDPYPAVTMRLIGPYTSIQRELFVDRISRLVSDIRTRDPHADVLEALDVAGQAIQGDFARTGTIYIEGSGLQEVGNLDLAEPGVIQVKPSAVVARLRSQVGLPPLRGDTVVLVGIGETAPPQTQLDPKQQAELRFIWLAIAKASGATVHMDFSPR
jgi:OmpA-OmpF porin, OOP family